MPEYSKCWNESCFLYGQYQECSAEKPPRCEECGALLAHDPPEGHTNGFATQILDQTD